MDIVTLYNIRILDNLDLLYKIIYVTPWYVYLIDILITLSYTDKKLII